MVGLQLTFFCSVCQERNEAAMLCQEADMPLETVLERYGGAAHISRPTIPLGTVVNNAVCALKKRSAAKVQSPVIRAKPTSTNPKDLSGAGEPGNETVTSNVEDIKTKIEEKIANGHCGDMTSNDDAEMLPVVCKTSVLAAASEMISSSDSIFDGCDDLQKSTATNRNGADSSFSPVSTAEGIAKAECVVGADCSSKESGSDAAAAAGGTSADCSTEGLEEAKATSESLSADSAQGGSCSSAQFLSTAELGGSSSSAQSSSTAELAAVIIFIFVSTS